MKHLTGTHKVALTLLKYICLLALCCLLVGCDVNISLPSTSVGTNTGGQCQSNCSVGTGANGLNVIVEPDAGPNPLVDAIRGAKQSVELEIYLLTNNFPYLSLRHLTPGPA